MAISVDYGCLESQRRRPAGMPFMRQSWRRLLFAHWRVDAGQIQALLPPGLSVQTCDGSAWLGVVPFEMRNIRPHGFPSVPWLSNFLELNVRTYVADGSGTPGVWFWSLSANRLAAVAGARRLYGLPYFWARMRCTTAADGTIDYHCRRFSDPQSRTSRYCYRPVGVPRPASPESLEFFLLERYLLFSRTPRGLSTGRVFHAPYQVQPVELRSWDEIPIALDGLPQNGGAPDHLAWCAGVDVEVFPLQRGIESSNRRQPHYRL